MTTTWKIEFDTGKREPVTVEADYYTHDLDSRWLWITFKDAAHKIVLDIPGDGIACIKRVDATEGRVAKVTLKANASGYIQEMERATAATRALGEAAEQARVAKEWIDTHTVSGEDDGNS